MSSALARGSLLTKQESPGSTAGLLINGYLHGHDHDESEANSIINEHHRHQLRNAAAAATGSENVFLLQQQSSNNNNNNNNSNLASNANGRQVAVSSSAAYLADVAPSQQPSQQQTQQQPNADNGWPPSTAAAAAATVDPTANPALGAGAVIAGNCAVCQQPILDRYLLVIMGVHYHEACLRCSTCQMRLIEVGNKCYRNRSGAHLCEKDYALVKQQQQQQSYLSSSASRSMPSSGGVGAGALIASSMATSPCCSCFRPLQPNDWVTVIHDKKYHAECFSCCVCRQRLPKGANFFMVNNQIWCEKDYHGGHGGFPGTIVTLHHHPDMVNNSSPALQVGMVPQHPLY